jgi:hypothetical protein
MKTILRHLLITPRNYPRICTRIVPPDQREAIRPGIRISYYAFTNEHGQQGYVIISHTTQRAGICFAAGRTEWGRWDEETGTITTDGGQRYHRGGEKMYDAEDQFLAQGEAPQLAYEP